MRSRNALYSWLEPQTNDPDSPLYGAALFRSLRGSVDAARKVVRVDCYNGRFVLTADSNVEEEEQEVGFVIQCFVAPDAAGAGESELSKLEEAKDEAFAMAREIYLKLAAEDQWPSYGVCNVYGDEFENTEETLGAHLRAVTYLFGTVNP